MMESLQPLQKETLIIKHLPHQLTSQDKIQLLRSFGAEEVQFLGKTGAVKHTAFAKFESEENAWSALQALHQAELLGYRLCVEFAKNKISCTERSLVNATDVPEQKPKKEKAESVSAVPKHIDELSLSYISTQWKMPYSLNPKLNYCYPEPDPVILTNICNALVSTPRFYTQVLHLMNKMNLPPPFNTCTPAPPLSQSHPLESEMISEEIQEVEMEEQSTEESEMESDTEDKATMPTKQPLQIKRKKVKKSLPRKKLDVKSMFKAAETSIKLAPHPVKPEEVFEQPDLTIQTKINLKLGNPTVEQEHVPISDEPTHGGFGKIKPQKKVAEVEEAESDAETDDEDTYISSRRLRKGRLHKSEMESLHVFKNYDAGVPSTCLYVKNVAKQTTEKDLRYIFGRYINSDNELEKEMFKILLMKDGRMKGQAFITLCSEQSAKIAVKETNGYVINNKPMVVQFARSAKTKT